MGINLNLVFLGVYLLVLYVVMFDCDSYDFVINEFGWQKIEIELLLLNLNWDVVGGIMIYIYGWCDYYLLICGDIDVQLFMLFYFNFWIISEQFSYELCFNIQLGKVNVIIGVYYYINDMFYYECCELFFIIVYVDINVDGIFDFLVVGIYQDGGGLYEILSVGVFVVVDYDLDD